MGTLLLIIIWWLLSVVVARMAENKGRSGLGWFVIALITSPLVGAVMIYTMPPRTDVLKSNQLANGHKQCPYCAEIIKQDAVLCRFCGKSLT